ncbi:hypothetical protein [Brytella acorum]|uniref:Uncharacterized protein n=1 Tax=Brytella acorum TaxID=2959299 RepID=A0AA35V8M6_9PROT|nr:hypothetical protein [Brytella acorum]MDF3625866.1 hypothetical protein [Brytella acorum]CAI9121579.1 hypothetical protein LMG32879_002426 [Brytella acorum]
MRASPALAIALFLTGTAMAAPPGPTGSDTMAGHPRTSPPESTPKFSAKSMADLDMARKMAICEKLEDARRKGAALTPAMQAPDAACRRMDSEMTAREMMGGTAPEATQER